jgi:hypothetical protein
MTYDEKPPQWDIVAYNVIGWGGLALVLWLSGLL